MKPFTCAVAAAFMLHAAPSIAGNLSEPIIEQEPVASADFPAATDTLVARDAIADETRGAADGGWLVPVLFLIYGAAVVAN